MHFTSSWSDQHIVANLFISIQWILSRLLFVHLLHVMLHHTKNLLACLTCRKATLPAQCRIVKRRRYRQTRVHIRTNKQWYDLRNKAFSFMFLCFVQLIDSTHTQLHQKHSVTDRRSQIQPTSICKKLQWFVSSKDRNRQKHALNGNVYRPQMPVGGKGGKSKGGSKGAPFVATSQSEENFVLAIQDAMPPAARHRLMPRLESEEWSVPVKSLQ